MHRLIYRSIHRLILVDTRSSIGRYIGRVSTDTAIGRYTWWLTETSPRLHRDFTDTSPTLYLHRVYQLISVDISVDTLVDTRPTHDRSINTLVSVDISADALVDTSVDSIKYRSIVSIITDSIRRQIGRLYRQTLARLSNDTRPTFRRQLTDIPPVVDR